MTEIALQESTGDPRGDKIVRGVIGLFEQAFPDRVRGYYLRGSYASGTAAPGSDLDLYVVFKDDFLDQHERETAAATSGHCALLAPVLLEILVVGEQPLQDEHALAAALNLKLATRLLYGEDIRPDLPSMRADAYVRSVVHTPYFSYAFPDQRRGHAVRYPLEHIDPDGTFYGYDQWLIPGADGNDVPSTKLLVASVGWTATAIIALRTGRYVRDKTACVELYQEHVGDEWTDLVVQVHGLCRGHWQYLVPSGADDRRVLRSLCEQALHFQNHFLGLYRSYLLSELEFGDAGRQALAARRLGRIVFPSDEVTRALRRLLSADDQEVRDAAATALRAYVG